MDIENPPESLSLFLNGPSLAVLNDDQSVHFYRWNGSFWIYSSTEDCPEDFLDGWESVSPIGPKVIGPYAYIMTRED